MEALGEITPLALAVLALLVFFAGFVDSLAGGGGLITLPAYLAAGLDPLFLLGTNKLSSSLGTLVAAWKYFRELRVTPHSLISLLMVSAAGSAAGAGLVLLIDPAALKYIMLFIIPLAAWPVILRHRGMIADLSSGLGEKRIFVRSTAVAFSVSAYDGFIGPGTGTFFALAFTRFCRYDLLKATALAKVFNLTSNLAALSAFLWAGRVSIRLGLLMALAGMAGNYAGSCAGISGGTRVIRPALLIVCAGLMVKLVLDMVR
ncbi:MAG: TSUP family transporter [bacterium]